MKKVILSLAVLATVALVSCGGSKGTDSESLKAAEAGEATVTEETTTVTEETVVPESGVQATPEVKESAAQAVVQPTGK